MIGFSFCFTSVSTIAEMFHIIEKVIFKFYLNKKNGNTEKHLVYLRIIVNRKKAEYATEYLININEWEKDKQRIKNIDGKSTMNIQLPNDVAKGVYTVHLIGENAMDSKEIVYNKNYTII